MSAVPVACAIPVAVPYGQAVLMATPIEDEPKPASQKESVFQLEGHLSTLMDAMAVDGWTINPAYHPAVTGFIQRYVHNVAFHKRALALQKNRATYYARTLSGHGAKQTVLATARNTALDNTRR